MSQEWNIRSRGHFCSICQKPLVDHAPVISALRETPEGYERFDCHPECWKTAERDWEPFSQWDGVYFAPVKVEKKEALKKEDAGELLRKLMTLDDPAPLYHSAECLVALERLPEAAEALELAVSLCADGSHDTLKARASALLQALAVRINKA